MNKTQPTRLLLGPQRPVSNLPDAMQRAALPEGPIAVVSAGWQEAEGDIDDVRQLVGRPLQDLHLYQRTEQLFHAEGELHDAYRTRQEELKEQQRLYRLRLRYLMIAARQVIRSDSDPAMVAAERRHAIAQLRALDRHHLHRVQAIHARFAAKFGADHYAPIAAHRSAIEETLADCQALLITGGNVIVLLNRMLLFDVGPLIKHRYLIAWSAGAMVLSDQIVLFHDRMPEGRRDPELLGPGLGLVPGYVLLPDARHRINSKDSVRLSLFCRRFAPAECVMLDCDSLLQVNGDDLASAESVRRIKPTGGVGPVKVA